MGAQKNQLNETVPLSTQNKCFNLLISYPFIYLESSKIHKYLILYAFYDVIVSILTPLCFLHIYVLFSVLRLQATFSFLGYCKFDFVMCHI